MAKYEIQAYTENCTGCLRCQLGCSNLYTKAFNPPPVAYIRVNVSGANCSITFTEDCTECGVCADHCFYGGLQKELKESMT
jgi:ferredoxin